MTTASINDEAFQSSLINWTKHLITFEIATSEVAPIMREICPSREIAILRAEEFKSIMVKALPDRDRTVFYYL